ncbi:MAG: XrtN system VIT domain-containing protein [Williamsia sp.]|nr:XrtN system VIT domain-containing protein [Williamsia sp.]
MTIFQQIGKDKFHLTGFIFMFLSLIVFWMLLTVPALQNDSGLFIINYLLAVSFFFIVLFSGRLKKGRDGLHLFVQFLVLFLISAYSLNREMVAFESSVTWLSCLLVLVCINYLAFAFWKQAPVWLLYIMHALLGIGFILFLYLACYLLPLYAVSGVAAFALGISLHTFVPLLFCIYTIVILRKTSAGQKLYQACFFAGIAATVMVTTAFVVRWSHVVHRLNTSYNRGIAEDNDGLPAFVGVAAAVPHGWVAEKVLQSGLVYNVPKGEWGDFLWQMPTRNFGEERKHDPLVMTAALFAGTPTLLDDERIKILEAVYDSRHKAQQRLWSGKHLATDNIHTAVRVWPQLHMAYTEKLITVTNNTQGSSRNNEEEAIYTFHLPEGSVVSALSLWIKGMEEKGIVTTKEKADSAYNTIVGYERRDPSVVHWQEGNTVSVRVFPVAAGKSRVFKLGITSPLKKQGDSLVYENIYFDGPGADEAEEEIKMDFATRPTKLYTEASLQPGNNLSFRHTGNYDPAWKIQFKDEGLASDVFSFQGVSYSLAPYTPHETAVDIQAAYLDINSSWTKAEFEKVFDAVRFKTVYVYDHELIRLTETNKEALFESLSQLQFSIFPLYAIHDAPGAVLISKSSSVSPNLHDLDNSAFMEETKNYLRKNTRIKLFNIGAELSPYLKSLKEFRAFDYEQGTAEQLKQRMAHNQFAASIEDDHTVVIDNAGLVIKAAKQTLSSTAPDHLMRLFTYNHLMQNAGARLFTDTLFNAGLTEEAARAGIVTPVSSLVVLETQQDYDRFNIKQSINSLKNATLRSKGAVPEPHEWVLIFIAVGVVLFVKYPAVRTKFRWS